MSNEDANQFMEVYKRYQAEETEEELKNREQLALAASPFVLQYKVSEPWMEFVRALREGGADAAMEMLRRKPKLLVGNQSQRNRNTVLGVQFEELQIAKVMAEVQRRQLPIELYAGDGRGVFSFQGNEITTPEYTDAVFRNIQTDEFFAVQFKYTDKTEKLVDMIKRWKSTHQGSAQSHLPEALKLENVQVIGPKDVVDGQLAKARVDIKFESLSNSVQEMEYFLDSNKTVFEKILDDAELQEKLERIKTCGKEATSEGNKAEKMQKNYDARRKELEKTSKIPENEKKVILQELLNKKQDHEQRQSDLLNEQNALIAETKAAVQKEMQSNALRHGVKHLGTAAAVGAVVNGVLSLVIACDEEIRLWNSGKISGAECARSVAKRTAVGVGRGALIGTGTTAPYVLSSLVTNKGPGRVLAGVSRFLGPAVLLASVYYARKSIISAHRKGELTEAEMNKALCRLYSSTTLVVGGETIVATAFGLPLLAASAAIAIIVGIGDHFLGDKLWGLLYPKDVKEAELRKQRLVAEVVEAAYKLLELTEDCSDEELKEAVRAASEKNDPNKGGQDETFVAVKAAHSVLLQYRSQRQ